MYMCVYIFLLDYAQLKPDVFAKYIPNIRPPTSISELDEYGAEDRKMQLELLHNPEFSWSVKFFISFFFFYYIFPNFAFSKHHHHNFDSLFPC